MKKNIELNEKLSFLIWHKLSVKDVDFLILLSNLPTKIIASILLILFYNLDKVPLDINILTVSILIISPYIYLAIFSLFKKHNIKEFWVYLFKLRTNRITLTEESDIVELKEYLNILITTKSDKTDDVNIPISELKKFISKYHKDCLKFDKNNFELKNLMKGDISVIFERIVGGSLPHLVHSDMIYSILKDLKKDKNVFFDTYLRNEKSFKNLFFDLSLKGTLLDLDVLLFALLIPRHKTLNLDYYKQIIKGCRLDSKESKINISSMDIFLSSPIKQLLNFLDQKEKIDSSFINYSDSDIVRLFSSKHNERDFIKIYECLTKEGKQYKLPVLKDFTELLHYIEFFDLVYDAPSFKEKIENLTFDNLKFKVVLSYGHLGTLANYLENCLKSRHSRLSRNMCSIIEIIKDGQTNGALEIVNKKVVEIKGYRNNHLDCAGKIKKNIESLLT
jgi:hypothetical protein